MAAVTGGSPSRSSSPNLESFIDLGNEAPDEESIENKTSEAVQPTLNGSSEEEGRVSPNLLRSFEETKTPYTSPARRQVTFSPDTKPMSKASEKDRTNDGQETSKTEEDPSCGSRLMDIFCCCFGSSKDKTE